jgi:hypothetical protein
LRLHVGAGARRDRFGRRVGLLRCESALLDREGRRVRRTLVLPDHVNVLAPVKPSWASRAAWDRSPRSADDHQGRETSELHGEPAPQDRQRIIGFARGGNAEFGPNAPSTRSP